MALTDSIPDHFLPTLTAILSRKTSDSCIKCSLRFILEGLVLFELVIGMEAREAVQLEPNSKIETFNPGDKVQVNVRIREGERQRVQRFEGDVIRKRGGGPSSSFTVRRIASGVGVERTFLIHSPNVESVVVVEEGIVRRAKLYYLRGLSGKAARIKRKRRVRK